MNNPTSHVIIFSHDFGVRKDDHGLFTAISQAVPDATSVLFDYNPINEKADTLTAEPLDEQARKLRRIINTERVDYPGAQIDLVCHGQGCVIAGLVKPRGIRKTVMLAPAVDVSKAAIIEQLGKQLDRQVDVTIRTRITGADGSTTVVRPEFWQSLAETTMETIKLYNRFARVTALRIIKARQDDVLGDVRFEGIDPTISLVTLDGDHNFEAEEHRNRLLYILKKELSLGTELVGSAK